MSYTVEQEARLTAAAPLDYEGAKVLAAELGVSPKSIVAKMLSMELEYIAKPVPAKRPKGATKAELVAEIAASLEVPLVGLEGLGKATGLALAKLLDALPKVA